MTEIQVLDGMLDPNLHDAEGRRHGEHKFVGEPYGPVQHGMGNWTLVVTYNHGRQDFPVKWLNPAGKCERRSRSFWADDQGGAGPIILRPDGWTRDYSTSPYACDSIITREGFRGPSTPVEHLAYENGGEVVFRNRWTRNLKHRPLTRPPPDPNKWPTEWGHKAARKARTLPSTTISGAGVYKPWTSSSTSTT
jgi:hypothetical protein